MDILDIAPDSNWSKADVGGWIRYELRRGKTKAEVVNAIVAAGWSIADADALAEVVVHDLSKETKTGRLFGRLACLCGGHESQWEYVDVGPDPPRKADICSQYLAVCQRCGHGGDWRTLHVWGGWYDHGPPSWKANEGELGEDVVLINPVRTCDRCGRIERELNDTYAKARLTQPRR